CTSARALAVALGLCQAACTTDPGDLPAPGHLALFVDTDAPLPSPPGTVRDKKAPPPLFDTLRIDVYRAGETEPCSSCSREFDANEAMFRAGASITIETAHPKSGARARVRLYRSVSMVDSAINPDSTIDVLVALPPQPSEGEHALTV